MLSCRDNFGSGALLDLDSLRNEVPEDIKESSSFDSLTVDDHQQKGDVYTASCREDVGTSYPHEIKENPSLKVRIRGKGILRDCKSPKQNLVTSVPSEGDVMLESPLCTEGNLISEVPEEGEGSGRSSSEQLLNSNLKLKIHDGSKSRSSYKSRTDVEGFDGMEENTSDGINCAASGIDSPEVVTGSMRTTRSMKIKVTSRKPIPVNLKSRPGNDLVGTSKNVGNCTKASDEFVPEEWNLTSNMKSRPRSTRNRQGGNHNEHPTLLSGRKSNFPVRKLSWLMLSEHEEGYRYIPQLGDEVVYLRQVIYLFILFDN